jgi:hypothetical protein
MASWIVYPSQLSQPPDFTDALNTSTRRHHSKSRAGCTVCKKRRIKCDETKPACRQCVDYGRQCSFLDTNSQGFPGQTQQPGARNLDVPNDELFEQIWKVLEPRAESSVHKDSLWIMLDHFTGCKDEWLAAPAFQRHLQQYGLQLGLRSEYLLHAILAMTASHLHYLDPTKVDFKRLSHCHYSLSLRLYREKLNDIQPKDTDAVFACGSVHTLLVIRYSMQDAIGNGALLGGFDSLLVGLTSIKSFPDMQCRTLPEDRAIESQPTDYFATCVFSHDSTVELDEEISKRTWNIAEIEDHLRQLVGSTVYEDTYREPFQYFVLASESDSLSSSLSFLFSFSHHLKGSYLEALKAQAPVALLLFCYWLVKLSAIKQWWITKLPVALCERFYVHLVCAFPATLQSLSALLAPISPVIGWGFQQ